MFVRDFLFGFVFVGWCKEQKRCWLIKDLLGVLCFNSDNFEFGAEEVVNSMVYAWQILGSSSLKYPNSLCPFRIQKDDFWQIWKNGSNLWFFAKKKRLTYQNWCFGLVWKGVCFQTPIFVNLVGLVEKKLKKKQHLFGGRWKFDKRGITITVMKSLPGKTKMKPPFLLPGSSDSIRWDRRCIPPWNQHIHY